MPNFLLTKSSVILCPHGGMVAHMTVNSRATVNGEPPMLIDDYYSVVGCPFTTPNGPSPCHHLVWRNPSTTCAFGGRPVLTSASAAIVQSATRAPQGEARIVAYQTIVTD